MSKEYEVTIYETIQHTTVVTATDEQQALLNAYEVISLGPESMYDTDSEGLTGLYSITEVD